MPLPPASSGGSARGRAALQVAIHELNSGAREIGGNNRGPFVVKYLNGLATEGSSWCAAFVCWCYAQHPLGLPFDYEISARKLRSQFTRGRNPLLRAFDPRSGYQPVPGDLVFWWRVSPQSWQGHVGIVHELRDGRLYTIEGNRGPKVAGFSYALDRMPRLLGFGHIADE